MTDERSKPAPGYWVRPEAHPKTAELVRRCQQRNADCELYANERAKALAERDALRAEVERLKSELDSLFEALNDPYVELKVRTNKVFATDLHTGETRLIAEEPLPKPLFDPSKMLEKTKVGEVRILREGETFSVQLERAEGGASEILHSGGTGEGAYRYLAGFVTGVCESSRKIWPKRSGCNEMRLWKVDVGVTYHVAARSCVDAMLVMIEQLEAEGTDGDDTESISIEPELKLVQIRNEDRTTTDAHEEARASKAPRVISCSEWP